MYIVLLNGIESQADAAGLLGDTESPPTQLGLSQCERISSHIVSRVPKINFLAASDAVSTTPLFSLLKAKCPHLQRKTMGRYAGLRERKFGVMVGSPIDFNLDMFKHPCILPEHGESVTQCKTRVMHCVEEIVGEKHNRTVIISHPFSCQIAMNAMLKRPASSITDFWLKRGAGIEVEVAVSREGISYIFVSAFNAMTGEQFLLESIYAASVQY